MVFFNKSSTFVFRAGSKLHYNAPVTVDSFGVERTNVSFHRQPFLYLNVVYDLCRADPIVPPNFMAKMLLEDDMANNSKLKITWDIAVAKNPTYNSVNYNYTKYDLISL